MHNRTARIAEQIQKELATILLRHNEEPLFTKTTITGVKVSPDFSIAKIFISIWDEKDIDETMTTLQRYSKSLRHTLAKSLNLRLTPKLIFTYDDTAAYAHKLSNLIDQAINSDAHQGKK